MKFVGHLDIMRYFQKAMRRADIDIAYSGGYSPHQIMSFAAPLGVGLTSDGEYMDIEVNSTYSTAEAVARLNAVMAEGVEVTDYRLLPEDAKGAMSIVAAADYAVTFAKEAFATAADSEAAPEKAENPEEASAKASDAKSAPAGMGDTAYKPDFAALAACLMERSTFPVIKKTKKSEAEIDLRPLIYKLQGDKDGLIMQVATGSAANIKPLQVLEALAKTEKEKYGTAILADVIEKRGYAILIKRLEVYADMSTQEGIHLLVPLAELGETIG